MVYSKIYKEGLFMKKKNDIFLNMKKIELLFCFLVFFVFVILLVKAFNSVNFIPACLIMGALECFSIGYYFRNNKNKINYVYFLFILGIVLLLVAIFYTIFKTV